MAEPEAPQRDRWDDDARLWLRNYRRAVDEAGHRMTSGWLDEMDARFAAMLRSAYQQGQKDEREACARLCSARAAQQRGEANAIIEHYGPDANDEASMYDADAIGAEALAKAIRARAQEEPKR